MRALLYAKSPSRSGVTTDLLDLNFDEYKNKEHQLVELELAHPHMAQKPVLRGEVGCACVAREVSVERGGMLVSKSSSYISFRRT